MPNLRRAIRGARPDFNQDGPLAASVRLDQTPLFAPGIQWFTASVAARKKRFAVLESRHLERPREDWVQFRNNQLAVLWFPAVHAETQTYVPPKKRFLDLKRHLERSSDDAWILFQANQRIIPTWAADDFLEESFRASARRVLDARWLERPSDSGWIGAKVNSDTAQRWPSIEFLTDSYRAPVRRVLDARWLEDISDNPWIAFPPSQAITNGVPAREFFAQSFRMPNRQRLDVRSPLEFHTAPLDFQITTQQFWPAIETSRFGLITVRRDGPMVSISDDGWIFSILVPAFDARLWPAIEQFISIKTKLGLGLDVRRPFIQDSAEWVLPIDRFSAAIDQMAQFRRDIYVASLLVPGIRSKFGRSSGAGPGFITPFIFDTSLTPLERFVIEVIRKSRDQRWVTEFHTAPLAFQPLTQQFWSGIPFEWSRTPSQIGLKPQWRTDPDNAWIFNTLFDPRFWPTIQQLLDSFRMPRGSQLDIRGRFVQDAASIVAGLFDVRIWPSIEQFTKSFRVDTNLSWFTNPPGSDASLLASLLFDEQLWPGVESLLRTFRTYPKRLWHPGTLERPQDLPFYGIAFDPTQFAAITTFVRLFKAAGVRAYDPRWLEQPQIAWIFNSLPSAVQQAFVTFINGKFFGRGRMS